MTKKLTEKLANFSMIVLSAGALSFSAPLLAQADNQCECTGKCMESCSKGDTHECSCDTCGCGKGKECSHGKCSKHDHKKESAPQEKKATK